MAERNKRIKNILNDGYEIYLGFELTAGQKDVLDRIDKFIKDKNGERLLTVSGVAGSGKTSIMECVRLRYMWEKNPVTGRFYKIFFASTTHRAAGVLKSKVKTKVYTLHSLFGISVETDMEGDVYDCKKKVNRLSEDKLDRDSIVVIDEASMINRENFAIIRDLCNSLNIKCIFCGDKCQLAPVGDNEGECSVVFNGEGGDVLELTEVLRTDNDHILKESLYVRERGDFSFDSNWDFDLNMKICGESKRINPVDAALSVVDKFKNPESFVNNLKKELIDELIDDNVSKFLSTFDANDLIDCLTNDTLSGVIDYNGSLGNSLSDKMALQNLLNIKG